MNRPEITGRKVGQLATEGALVATPNETMSALNIGRAKLYELINQSELESYLEGEAGVGLRPARKILWPSIHAYIERRLAAEADRRGRASVRSVG